MLSIDTHLDGWEYLCSCVPPDAGMEHAPAPAKAGGGRSPNIKVTSLARHFVAALLRVQLTPPAHLVVIDTPPPVELDPHPTNRDGWGGSGQPAPPPAHPKIAAQAGVNLTPKILQSPC